ncbi:MAG: OmpA family protein, partial [Acidimicrobiales bacterium]|nr:OmpA family protein [Acidimicrobiales bacterium]
MFDDEEEDQGFFLVVLGVLAAILLIVTVVARRDDASTATVRGDTAEEAVEDDEDHSDDAAAAETTTTAAPTTTTEAPTTTTEAPTTTTEAPTTTATPELTTMWDALDDSGQATQFATIGSALGLQESLEETEAGGAPLIRTLLAPSDAAIAALPQDVLGGLVADPAGAAALVEYHILPGRVTLDDLRALDGQTATSLSGLPLSITVDGDDVIVNGASRLSDGDFDSDNGMVHIIDQILTPPTVNEVLGLENIEFESGSAVITAAGQTELQKAITFFSENEALSAQIQGHTDTSGDAEFNLGLSQARADSVQQFLTDNGIAADRLEAVGFGETQPILVDGVEDQAASRR